MIKLVNFFIVVFMAKILKFLDKLSRVAFVLKIAIKV